MIVWNGMDIISLVILGVCVAILILIWLLITIQNKIDEYFERRNK